MPDPHSSKNRPAGEFRRWLVAAAVVASVFLAAGLLVWYKDTRTSSPSLATAPFRELSAEDEKRELSLDWRPRGDVYRTHCAHCHEPVRDELLGPPLLEDTRTLGPRLLDDTTPCRSDDWMYQMISRGGRSVERGTATAGSDIHGFERVLTRDEIEGTILYIRMKKYLSSRIPHCLGESFRFWMSNSPDAFILMNPRLDDE